MLPFPRSVKMEFLLMNLVSIFLLLNPHRIYQTLRTGFGYMLKIQKSAFHTDLSIFQYTLFSEKGSFLQWLVFLKFQCSLNRISKRLSLFVLIENHLLDLLFWRARCRLD